MMDIINVEGNYQSTVYKVSNNSYILPVDFDYVEQNSDSKLRNFFTQEEREEFKRGDNSFFFHNFAFELEDFNKIENLKNNYYPVIIFHKDAKKNPKNFIAGIEHKKYPIYIIQIHPEKILFENEIYYFQNSINLKLSLRYSDFIK